MTTPWLTTYNGEAVAIGLVPSVSIDRFRKALLDASDQGDRLLALTGWPVAGGLRLLAAVAVDASRQIRLTSAPVQDRYSALTPELLAAHYFEREIAEQFGVHPAGHPWLKPVRQTEHGPGAGPSLFQVAGEEVHEVAVGPVHAGIIEPGHFRFQCHGERVLHLEIALGYQHRGVEQALLGGPTPRTLALAETLSGDATLGHTTAYCQVVETLAHTKPSARANLIRAVGLELERIANHVGDLGAIAGDIGFLPTAAYCGALRGTFLNLTLRLTGNRVGRGLLRPGGVAFAIDDAELLEVVAATSSALEETRQAVELLWSSPSVRARLERIGTVDEAMAETLGMVGPAARASGLYRDARRDHPTGLYRHRRPAEVIMEGGDCFARAMTRWLEIIRSVAFLQRVVHEGAKGEAWLPVGPLAANHLTVSLVEGWRGEICHLATTDAGGRFLHYKVIDPSFHNWFGLAMALRNQAISDFPVCNKSFNLSYCGHDL
ncbi:MAG: hydrogenase [Nitrospirae bacterium CG18_big_fil_WC_8_21_14_2_50_70_55]|nr:hydrogenase [Deltaproteobacteria bacterium]OIP66434.1 MAG: hypothetical protein AUK30_02440 [Nitrospirae bacterium CG2_30_70_394]PIQ05695.1 MAG: hydrogenase [Nitrospirae bacterium CG18_big_fil_WC_8_21_14_2_50_70_55]PIU79508.1 MAG: hydrogenase [Nitrospirae bacterium CG06_land_8_20_14_3_00_70_43]PIW83820.1 MAG: hydrogenase [Nitrospirae bacterium CG_4_8_14_3_um_filter_70_85]PIX82199.1 MAG: hydrogenase [Nitrospirae bacterium CG_4_10_14_3_um_filter_70_108]PJB96577.1 MAG: hydrogenase [Nitrospira